MSSSTAIRMLDEKKHEGARRAKVRRLKRPVPAELMDEELGRFLKRLARSSDFDSRQLQLPIF